MALPHSEEVSDQMENVWEIIVPENGIIKHRSIFFPDDKTLDLMRGENVGWVVVTEKMKTWLEQNQAEWVEFEEMRTETN